MGFLPLTFAAPFMLAALVALPAIWWLLRFTPPRPRRLQFPPTRLLMDLKREDETPHKSPWWLTLLRMVLAALVILALAGPVWNPQPPVLAGSGPVLIAMDTGWASAPDWERRREAVSEAIAEAGAADRPIVFVATGLPAGEQDLTPKGAGEAERRLAALAPAPHQPDRADLVEPLARAVQEAGIQEAVFFSDGLENGNAALFAQGLAEVLPDGAISVVAEGARLPLGLKGARNTADDLRASVVSAGATPTTGIAQVKDMRGRVLGEAPFEIAAGARETEIAFPLPVELRNEATSVDILAERSAGAVQLLDDNARRRRVGLVSGEAADTAQPLLSPLHYIGRALEPFADLSDAGARGASEAISSMIEDNVSVIVLADVGNVVGEAASDLARWIDRGGTLVRFSGPRMAAGADDLVPVQLRSGGRVLGGSLSWSEPQPLAPLAEGPFAGIEIQDDIRVERQVLAEPSSDLADRIWATLDDGTPLVTAAERGEGRIVLFHVTADTRWSNLPLSGTFVDMLRRITAAAPGTVAGSTGNGQPAAAETDQAPQASAQAEASQQVLPPWRVLNGRGEFVPPPGQARPLALAQIDTARPGRDHPPGLYGTETAHRALNLLAPDAELVPLDTNAVAGFAAMRAYSSESATDMKPWLLAAAAIVFLLDALAVLFLASGVSTRLAARRAAAGASALLLAGLILPSPAAADDALAMEATLDTHLAYVVTGNSEIDETSRAGLEGLTRFLTQRTALEPAEPIGLDPAEDELAFFPLIYWPVDPEAPMPDSSVLSRMDEFMKQGGTILFDTRDEIYGTPGDGASGGPGMSTLRAMLESLDLPPLEPVANDHVITKTFFLLQDFPGRYQGGELWSEALPEEDLDADRPAQSGDGVSGILITSNDFAGAWATDENGRALYPTVPNDPQQREHAFRSGVNIVMYALTGNYKADQVHIPSLLERLGQ